MKILDFGTRRVAVALITDRWPALTKFIDVTAWRVPVGPTDLQLAINAGEEASLVLDHQARLAVLTVPHSIAPGSTTSVVPIAVLQAAARCLALLGRPRFALLHGSATRIAQNGGAVAVLDGGCGQGKTSLALGLALAGGEPLVDEFVFAEFDGAALYTASAPSLPWHVRSDMAPYLVPHHPQGGLLLPVELPCRSSPRSEHVDLTAVLVPDLGRGAGEIEIVLPDAAERLLRPALSDHRNKLLDPRLDHVSLFVSPAQVVAASGRPLTQVARTTSEPDPAVVEALVQLPTFLVGISEPADIGLSVKAALEALRSL